MIFYYSLQFKKEKFTRQYKPSELTFSSWRNNLKEYAEDLKELILLPYNLFKKWFSTKTQAQEKKKLVEQVYVHRGFNKQYQDYDL